MEKIDTQPPYGSFGLEEWIEYNVLRKKESGNDMISGDWKTRILELKAQGYGNASEDNTILQARERGDLQPNSRGCALAGP